MDTTDVIALGTFLGLAESIEQSPSLIETHAEYLLKRIVEIKREYDEARGMLTNKELKDEEMQWEARRDMELENMTLEEQMEKIME